MRIFVQIVIPLLLPVLAYIAWAAVTRRYPLPEWWRHAPWAWLTGIGVVLVAGSLIFWAERAGFDPDAMHLAPRLENGRVVPGTTVPQ